jgi:hypothetical protein
MRHEPIYDDEGNEVRLYTFEEILPFLKHGEFVRRVGWSSCFAIYMALRHHHSDKTVSPAVENIILLEGGIHGSTPNLTMGWKPHTRDFLANDWHCVNIILEPRAINPDYKPPAVIPIPVINEIHY